MLPAVMADYDSLSAEQLGNIVRMNHTFCGLHTIHNIGSTAKETLCEFETLVGFLPVHPHLQSQKLGLASYCGNCQRLSLKLMITRKQVLFNTLMHT